MNKKTLPISKLCMEMKKRIIENFTKINNQVIVNFDLKQALEIGQELFRASVNICCNKTQLMSVFHRVCLKIN